MINGFGHLQHTSSRCGEGEITGGNNTIKCNNITQKRVNL